MIRSLPPLPHWADVFLLPILNLLAAFVASGVVIWFLGENPFEVLALLFKAPFLYPGNMGYTLYYTTNFIFAGLAVAVAFHAKMFNIGGEGQAMIGGLGAGLVALAIGPSLPWFLVLPLAVAASALFGAAWAAIPGYLQAKRGSHIVITTIMFNFIASALLVYLLGGVLMQPGQMSPQTAKFAESATLPFMHEILGVFGWKSERSPMNFSFFLALLACLGVWVLIWRTRLGYEIRAVGHNPDAAQYAGINVTRVIILTMAISGALAGLMATNEVLGASERVIVNFTNGYGFTGIAVALIGRNHPVGILFASLLFGWLFQGGTEVDFGYSSLTKEMVLLIQGLIILFAGALYYLFDPLLARLFFALGITGDAKKEA